MENKKIKKVIVELEDGSKMEFNGQVVLFVEDKMSDLEKMFNGDNHGKICGVIQCNPCFLASVTNSALDTLAERTPGLDFAVMAKHLDSKEPKQNSIMSVLADILG